MNESEDEILSHLKTKLTIHIINEIKRQKLSLNSLSEKTNLSREFLDDICSFQSINPDLLMLIRILTALGKKIDIEIKNPS
jgi:DNA-binding phage protein